MKTKLFFLPILALTATLSVSAQQIENDDMYFTAKDRTKEKTAEASSLSTNNDIVARGIKSTDQYSGRTVNPEYTSRFNANSKAIQGSSNPYFDSGYQSNTTTNSGYYNNGYSNNGYNGFNNSYYGNSFNNPYYGNSWNPYSNLYGYSGMYGMYGTGMGFSPYSNFYSSFYSPFGYTSGLSMGLAFGNGFYSPYGYNSMMFGYGGGFGGYGYPYYGYYPGTVIINNGDGGSNMVYGKRSSRSSIMSRPSVSDSRRMTSPVSTDQGTQYSIPTGRTSSTRQQYYQPNWRNNPDINSTINNSRQSGSSYNRSESLGTQRPSWNGGTNSSRQMQNPGWNNTRQSMPSNNNFGMPSRGGSSMPSWGGSSGGGSMGGGSIGHSSGGSRGRN